MIKYSPGNQGEIISQAISKLEKSNINQRLWKKDARLWKSDPAFKKQIVDRLGWLDIAEWMLPKVKEIESFSKKVLKDGIKTVVLLGMGGSSLCPEVLSEIMGIKKGCPKFYMLDSTDPEFIRTVESKLNLTKTLFIVSSKSGGTVETNSQYQYFYAKLSKLKKGQDVGAHFVAITDEGTSLQKLATDNQFRKTFINPSDIGGRYSALSYFGMVPAALMGINVTKFLNNAIAMKKSIQKSSSLKNNPAITLGIVCAELAKCGMDKTTLLIPGKLASLGYWIEQLVAESTGKENLGVLPIEGEKIQAWDAYDNDRLFVVIRLKKEKTAAFDKKLEKLKDVGYTVIEITLDNEYDLAGEFYRWEIATAVMGIVFQIDPFDQPNVQSAKTLTSKILQDFEKKGKFPVEKPIFKSGNLSIYSNSKLWSTRKSWKHLEELLFNFLSTMQINDYVGILAYLAKSSPIQKQFDQWRDLLQKQLSIATVQGYGPRYLHSIGQLYKGGKNNGLFIEFTIQESKDIKVPKAPYSFGELKSAQAMGDYQALQDAKRRVLRVELGKNYKADLKTFEAALLNLLSRCQCSCSCDDCEGEK